MIKDATNGLTASRGALGVTIRKFLREPNDPARVNHAMGLFLMTQERYDYLVKAKNLKLPSEWVGQWCVIEADFKVKITPWDEYKKKNLDIYLFTHTKWSRTQRNAVVDAWLEDAGGSYSIPLLVVQGLDKIRRWIGRRSNLVARFGPEARICSKFTASGDCKAGYCSFDNKLPWECDPDDMWDEFHARPEVWESEKVLDF